MLLFARMAGKQGGVGFIRDTMTRLMGLIVLSMGVQFALTGYHAFTGWEVACLERLHGGRMRVAAITGTPVRDIPAPALVLPA